MKVGDIVTWPWYLGTGWKTTKMQGLIVSSKQESEFAHSPSSISIFSVLLIDGTLCDVREDEDGLESVINEGR